METKYLEIEGDEIEAEYVSIGYAVEFITAITSSPYCELVKCLKLGDNIEIVIFETEVERPQKPVNDIQKTERLAVYFERSGEALPSIFALRDNFPCVVHLNITEKEFPRSLCIYEESFDELKLKWTCQNFLEDIRNWLALTAKGKLHAEDQLLEPLLLPSSKFIIIPLELVRPSLESKPIPLRLRLVQSEINKQSYILECPKIYSPTASSSVMLIQGKPQIHGIISKIPANLLELHNFLKNADIDLLDTLRNTLKTWKDDKSLEGIIHESLIIMIVLPKRRSKDSDIENYDLIVYSLSTNILTLGKEIGIWDISNGQVGMLLKIDESKDGQNVTGELLNPVYAFDKMSAQISNGIKNEKTPHITAIGLGTLGSQIFMNLIRTGFDSWDLIDKDILMPHNLARHSLLGVDIGFTKTERLALTANNLYRNEVAKSIPADVLKPGQQLEILEKIYTTSELILDMSASVSVARKLAIEVTSNAKRMSAFLSPNGKDGVLLCEDAERKIRLDFLEMAYYRYISQERELYSHLERNKERIRYGNSCRDVSFILPQDLVNIHAGIFTRAIKNAINSTNHCIKIWKVDLENHISVREFNHQIEEMYEIKSTEWTIITDKYFMDKVSALRLAKLPNETGGVLIGSYDMSRKIVYIVDTIPSPDDSIEWPTVYIRGCKGLDNEIKKISKTSDQMLTYIGEWHSHPKGSNSLPSGTDVQAFAWLTEVMGDYGLPAFMFIKGEDFGFYIGNIV